MARLDPHSHADSEQPETASLDWRARVDFANRTLDAEATLHFRSPGAGALHLDTRGLRIHAVTTLDGDPLPFHLDAPRPILGERLAIELPPGTAAVRIRYATSPDASALQWLDPAQTADRRGPFLFSQCQAIHARSVVPLQDTPRIRITYRMELRVPVALRALAAAAFVDRREDGDEAVETWSMPQPVPPYLLAFAVGDLVARDLGPRTRVWAEPSVLDAAAWEFAGVESRLAAAEALFGPYDWERFDVLVMPPSFPYGGMENPRLTFLTPTLLAGDRSQVRVVAHELAHAWTGNLVTNASAEHFWLNEGWTRYAEMRIVEATEGADVAALHAAVGRRGLERAIRDFREQGRPELTRLRTRLEGIDPDDAFSEVPYDKGYLFLRTLEESVGRGRFDAFVRRYIAAHRFRSITTEAFVDFVDAELPGALTRIDADAWIHGEGVPAGAPEPRSALLDAVEALGARVPDPAEGAGLGATEWQLYLDSLPRPLPLATCAVLDARFGLTARRNYEVLASWLVLALEAGFEPARVRAEALLGEVGRMKYLKPLYRALLAHPSTRPVALRAFERYGGSYHPIARAVIGQLLAAAS